ncbi:MAG: hypothetical protein EXS30_06175 [Pedosphaera sp.]|nr:hypothetical protein [Pedosphaera sp.]
MNTFVGWTPFQGSNIYHNEPAGFPNSEYKMFNKTSDGRASEYFVFSEVHPFSICRPPFGTHPGGTTQGRIYHLPGNYNIQASTFSFGDGHAQPHKWVNCNFNNSIMMEYDGNWHNHDTPFPAHGGAQAIASDLDWLNTHTTYKN